jgi:hypothetical protein
MKTKEEIIKKYFKDDLSVMDDNGELTLFGEVIASAMEEYKEGLNETLNASNHSHLIIDFEKGENNLNNK